FGLLTCALGTLDPLDSISLVLTTKVGADVTAATVSNTAQASSTTPDSVPANGSATANTDVDQVADLGIVKTVSAGSLVAGSPVRYTLVVTNAGPSASVGTSVVDLAPAGVTFTSVSTTLGICDLALTCDLGTLPPGGTVTIVIVGDVSASVADTATI